MVKTPQFYLLWFMFVIAASAGLMTISNIKPFTVQFNFADLAVGFTAAWFVMTMYSVFNAAGRIAWGMTSERIGRITTMIIMFSILGITMILFGGQTDLLLIVIGASVIGFCFGGNFALFPSTTADYFGSKNIGLNYALVFTSYGIAGIFGPLLAAGLTDTFGGYSTAFTLLGLLSFVAVGLAVVSEYINRKAQVA
jgi:OFA family oxalate/formate antiporter-like MFS transporter